MKVFLTIWILAVLIQEVVPGTLVRLPRNADKNLSLVHTEYEAKYEQKGKHGNESFSTVSGKQEIVHDNCAENWNTFAEKCASLIKDLVASLANAVSSKPGDATNLQLHIKNTFRHFDNTHNCTCLSHSGRKLSDLDLSPLFSNITIKSVHPGTKNSERNSSESKNKKCGGTGQPCDEKQSSDPKNNKSIGIVRSGSNDPESDQNKYHNHGKKCGQSGTEPCDKHDDKHPEHQQPHGHHKQLNHALVDDKDLDMNPENAEGSGNDQSTNNSRRQIMYPPNLEKPRKISKNSDRNSFSPNSNPTQPKNTKNVRYPFLVTPRPMSQSGKPSESPSLSGQSLDPDSESPSVLLPQENSSAHTNVPAGSSTDKANEALSSASSVSTSPSNRNSSPNNLYLQQPPQTATEPHSPSYHGDVPKEISPSKGQRTYQHPVSAHERKSPSKSSTNRNSQPPVVTVAEPVIESHNSEPEMSGPTNAISRRPYVQAGDMVTDKQNSAPLKSNDQLNTHSPITVPEDQIIESHKSAPEQSINNEQSGEPALIFPEESIAEKQRSNDVPNTQSLETDPEEQPTVRYSSNSAKEMPLQSVGKEQPTIMHQESPSADTQALGSEFIPEDEKDDQSSAPPEESNNDKLNGQPMIVFPEKAATKNSESAKEEPQPIIILPEETQTNDNAADPSATDTVGNIPQEHPKSHNSASPVYIRNERPAEEHPDLEDDSTQPQENPIYTTNEDSTKHKHSPNSHFNSNHPESLEPTDKDQTMDPSYVESLSTDSASNPSSKPLTDEDSANLSPEDTHFKHVDADDQIVLEHTTTCAPTMTSHPHGGHDLDHTVSVIYPASKEPEMANQQSEDLISSEENPHAIPTSDQSHVIAQVFTEMPQKTLDTEVYDPEEGHQWDSNQPNQEPMFTTPAPNYSANIFTVIPDNQSKPKMTADDYDLQEKENVESRTAFVSINPEETENEHCDEQVHSEMKGTTPVVFYPEKSAPNEAQSAERPEGMNGNSGFLNNENQEPFTQEYFITPAPTSTVRTTEVVPEQHNGNAENRTNEDSVPSHAPHLHEEHFVIHSPTKKSEDDDYSRVTAQSDNVTEKPTKPHSDHHSQGQDYSSVPHARKHSEGKVISAEPDPETAMPRPVLKPSRPGALVSTTEAQPHQEEGQNLLLHPTTFQTTSEEPTPAQGSASLSRPTTSVPQDSDETFHGKPSTSPKTTRTHEHDDDDEEDCCSCESCTEEEITDPKQYRENACKNLEEARRELKAIFDKIKKKLKCGRKAPQTITAS